MTIIILLLVGLLMSLVWFIKGKKGDRAGRSFILGAFTITTFFSMSFTTIRKEEVPSLDRYKVIKLDGKTWMLDNSRVKREEGEWVRLFILDESGADVRVKYLVEHSFFGFEQETYEVQ